MDNGLLTSSHIYQSAKFTSISYSELSDISFLACFNQLRNISLRVTPSSAIRRTYVSWCCQRVILSCRCLNCSSYSFICPSIILRAWSFSPKPKKQSVWGRGLLKAFFLRGALQPVGESSSPIWSNGIELSVRFPYLDNLHHCNQFLLFHLFNVG